MPGRGRGDAETRGKPEYALRPAVGTSKPVAYVMVKSKIENHLEGTAGRFQLAVHL